MDSSEKENNWDETMHSSNYHPGSHEFARSDKDIVTAARYPTEIEEICQWAATTKRNKAHENRLQSDGPEEADTGVISDAPYRHIIDPYETRVLEIHPGNFSDNLKGTLHYCSLEFGKEKPLANAYEIQYYWLTDYALSSEDLRKPIWYTALSYTWGEPDPTTDAAIECGGYKIKITHSLETALRYFRQSDHSINMWVDQICIDQSNNKEKEQQIPLMSKIYGHAASTVIWLGEATEGSVEAFELLKRLGIFFDGCGTPPPPEDFERVFLCSEKDMRWKHLWDLVNRRWFTRLWIIQEVILSQKAWIICGETEFSWGYFMQCLSGLFYSNLFAWLKHAHGETYADHQAVGWKIAKMLGEEYLHDRRSTDAGLPHTILAQARDAQASDSRDKIYGLLGVCNLTGIEVSYDDSMTAACLYRAATAACIENTGLHTMLCCIDHQSELKGLPSWVPDWSLSRQTESLGSNPNFASNYIAAGNLSRHLHSKAAALGLSLSCTIHPDGKTLSELGKVFDIVRDTSEVCSRPDITREDTLNSNQHFVAWANLAKTCHPYPSGCKLFDAFWRTLVANRNDDGWQRSPSSYSEIFSLLLDESTGRCPSLPDQTYSPRQLRPKGRGKLELANLATRAPAKLYQEILTALRRAMRNRRLGTTDKGYLGLFPRQTKVGDVVCILSRCGVPFVLRKAEDGTFKVVGECYVHGIMDGEVVAMEDVPWTSVVMT